MRLLDVGTKFGMQCASIFIGADVINRELSISKIEGMAINRKIDLISFGGGGDIHPSLYGHRNIATHCGENPSYRDLFEIEVWKIAQKYGLPVLGICRGAQLACALSGGELIQDIDRRHSHNHIMDTIDGEKVPMTSAHHQMMHPYRIKNHQLLAWITPGEERFYNYDINRIKAQEIKLEPEVIYFPDTNALAIQGHPEFYGDPYHPSVEYVRGLVDRYLLGGRL